MTKLYEKEFILGAVAEILKLGKIALILLLLVGVVGCTTQERQGDVLVVGTTPTYPPYEGINSDGECEGFDIDVAQALAEKLKKKLIVKELDFDALILGLKQGKIDLIISGMSITPSRLKEVALVPYQGESVTSLTFTFWEKVPENYSSITDLKVVAVQVGTYQEAYLQSLDNLKIKSLEGNAEIILDLQYGKSSAAAFEPQIAQAMKSEFQELQLVELPMEEKGWVLGYGIGVKKENETLIRDVTEAINELKDEGVIQQLESKWLEI